MSSKHRMNAMRQVLKVLFVSLTFQSLIGCAINPVTGENRLDMTYKNETREEARVMYASLKTEARSLGVLDSDRNLSTRVNKIADSIINQAKTVSPISASWQWETHVINDDDVINAFCMAGGKIIIFSGIINRLNLNDDEIAVLLGHEAAHALASHLDAQYSLETFKELMSLMLYINNPYDEQSQELNAKLFDLLFAHPYSRGLESEADSIGVELAARAGYSPQAGISLWRKMASLSVKTDKYPTTHPSNQARIAAIQNLIINQNGFKNMGQNLSLTDSVFNTFVSGGTILSGAGFGAGMNSVQTEELYKASDWVGLAVVVSKIGYEEDLYYYYLGRAAEELGYKNSSLIYYKKAKEQNSSTFGRCKSFLLDQCEGLDVKREIDTGLERVIGYK